MAANCRVYDSLHLQADCQEPGSAPEPYTLGNRIWATFLLVAKDTYTYGRCKVQHRERMFAENYKKITQ